jgi:hypothetical protein
MTCIRCKCTDSNACITDGVPCHWVKIYDAKRGICSACPTRKYKVKRPGQKAKRSTKVPLSFRLPFEHKRRLEEIAAIAKMSVDQVVTVIIATYIANDRASRKQET